MHIYKYEIGSKHYFIFPTIFNSDTCKLLIFINYFNISFELQKKYLISVYAQFGKYRYVL